MIGGARREGRTAVTVSFGAARPPPPPLATCLSCPRWLPDAAVVVSEAELAGKS